MSIQALVDVLENMNAQHVSMLELAERKKQAIIQNDIDEMTRIVNKERKFITTMQQLDELRQEAIFQYLQHKGFKSNLKLSITELLRLVFNVEEKEKLKEVQQKLSKTLSDLKDKNAVNQQLIQQSLTFVNYSIELLTSGPEDDVIYRHPAQNRNSNNKSWFHTRV